MSESDTPHTTVALTTEIAAKLQHLADMRGRTVNDVALEAIQHYLDGDAVTLLSLRHQKESGP